MVPRNDLSAIFETAAAQSRCKRRRDPSIERFDRLAIKVSIKQQCARSTWRREFGVHVHRRARRFENACADASTLEQGDKRFRVTADVVGVRRDIAERQQIAQFADNGFFVRGDMVARGAHGARHHRCRRGRLGACAGGSLACAERAGQKSS